MTDRDQPMQTSTETTTEDTRTENPALALTRVAVCLHYVERLGGSETHACEYPHCRVMESMELDLLAYRFQEPPPFGSRLEPPRHPPRDGNARRPIVIEYPAAFVYHSEGRSPQLVAQTQRRKADVLVSSTRFLNTGLRIWHITLTPRAGETFNEFDIIKLIHLYDGRTERTGLKDLIRFGLGDGDQDDGGQDDNMGAVTAGAADLPRLLDLNLDSDVLPELRCGTLELIVGPEQQAEEPQADNPYVCVLETLRRAREDDGEAEARQLKTWMANDCLQRRIIMAYCGIVTGIFDFDRIDDEEALDTLEPTFASASAFLRIHRRSLICIADDDRSLRECWDSVGISPYLIIPHAALLYNETLVDTAERALDSALGSDTIGLEGLESTHIEADRQLHTLYLPNVFNYITERSLFDAGGESRGSNARRSAVLAKLGQLKDQIDIVRERERNRGQVIIQVLLAVISVLQLKGIITDIFDWKRQNPEVWLALSIGALLLMIVVWWSYNKGLPQRIVSRRNGDPR